MVVIEKEGDTDADSTRSPLVALSMYGLPMAARIFSAIFSTVPMLEIAAQPTRRQCDIAH